MQVKHNDIQNHHYPISSSDASTIAAIRQQTAPFKGKTFGPEGRAGYDDIMNNVPEAKGVSYEPAVVGGVSGYWCYPTTPQTDVSVLFLHGGGYVMGTAQSYRHFAGHFAQRLQAAVFVADYRLAPEHPFPAALEDAFAAYVGLVDAGAGAKKIVVIGDSAGGGLSLSLLSFLQNDPAAKGIQKPVAAAVMSPWTDLLMEGESMRFKADEELYLTEDMLKSCAAMYLQDIPLCQTSCPNTLILK